MDLDVDQKQREHARPALSRFVVKTKDQDKDVFYNTVTKHVLPEDSSPELLESELFLAGQENKSIERVLTTPPEVFHLTVIPTWECNLRCSHCSVLTLLKKKDPDKINPDDISRFADLWLERFPSSKYLIFALLGGEPLLRTQDCIDLTKKITEICKERKVNCLSTLTTNLTLPITDSTLELFDYCCEIGVSLDGNKFEHNWQRKSLNGDISDPWQLTYENIKILVEHGFADKIRIKAALRDQHINKENYKNFLTSLAEIGVNLDRVTYGVVHPTEHHAHLDSPNYTSYILKRIKLIPIPCCKFRMQNQFHVEPNGDLYDAYFRYARDKIGNVSESIDTILERRKEVIRKTFPVFNDPGCSDCPVVGYCWGGCINSRTLVKDRPSQFCNRAGLTEHVNKLAENGNLVAADRGENPIKYCERESERINLL